MNSIICVYLLFVTRPEKMSEVLIRSHGNARMKMIESKMVFSTTGGSLIVIDNLNLATLQEDFEDYTLSWQYDAVG